LRWLHKHAAHEVARVLVESALNHRSLLATSTLQAHRSAGPVSRSAATARPSSVWRKLADQLERHLTDDSMRPRTTSRAHSNSFTVQSAVPIGSFIFVISTSSRRLRRSCGRARSWADVVR
jgi:hypothetical protein